jgi:hypothetical protein
MYYYWRESLCMAEYMDRAYSRFRMAVKQSVVTPLMEGIQGEHWTSRRPTRIPSLGSISNTARRSGW